MRRTLLIIIALLALNMVKGQKTLVPVVQSLSDAIIAIEQKGYQIEKVVMTKLAKNLVEHYVLKSGLEYGFLVVCSPKVEDVNCFLYKGARAGKWVKVKVDAAAANTATVKYTPYKDGKYRFDVRINKKKPNYNNEYFYLVMYSKI